MVTKIIFEKEQQSPTLALQEHLISLTVLRRNVSEVSLISWLYLQSNVASFFGENSN